MSRQLPRRRPAGDRGATMIDMVVAMTLMSIFMSLFTGGVVRMFRSANRTQALTAAQTQVTNTFLRLDKEIRYAAGISTPGPVGADSYVEYVTSFTGTAMCTELRLNVASGQLQRRTWQQGVLPLVPSAWIPMATSVSSTQPFTFLAADATFNFQRLQLKLDATSGGGPATAARRTDVTFTALNTTLATSSATACTEGRSVP
jgi:hypothetical protein